MSNLNSLSNYFTGVHDANTIAVIVCSALALYNALELKVSLLTSFYAYRGLYFWAFGLATFGLVPYTIGYLMTYFSLSHLALGVAFNVFGWVVMITGQSVVLYSRLWLLFGESQKPLLKMVKCMIIANALVMHGSMVVITFGGHFSQNTGFVPAYHIVQRIQACAFCFQEVVLSSLYVWKAFEHIKTSAFEAANRTSQRLVWHLFAINIILVFLDLTVLVCELLSVHLPHLNTAQQALKGFIYSLKLKLEIAMLSRLGNLSARSAQPKARTLTFGNIADFVDLSKSTWDVARSTPAFLNLAASPQWMSDLEKSDIQTVEASYFPQAPYSFQSRSTRSYSPDSMSCGPFDERQRRSSTDLLYAGALRELATTG